MHWVIIMRPAVSALNQVMRLNIQSMMYTSLDKIRYYSESCSVRGRQEIITNWLTKPAIVAQALHELTSERRTAINGHDLNRQQQTFVI